jgi:hypothetical protein
MSTPEGNKALVRRYMEEGVNNANPRGPCW